MIPILRRAALWLALAPAAQSQDFALDFRSLALPAGDALEYAVLLPPGFDPAVAHPILIALPPGDQSRAMVEAGFAKYWRGSALRDGYVVVSPIARPGERFLDGGEEGLAPLLRRLRVEFRVEGPRFDLAGASDGGRSAFRLAARFPFEFRTLVALPGHAVPIDERGLAALRDITVRMFVGGEDREWLDRSRATERRLRELGVDVELVEIPGEGHVPAPLEGDAIPDVLRTLRERSRPIGEIEGAIAAVLDDFHDAAARADAERYFGHFTADGVFLGTDPAERWDVDAFRTWAGRAFQRDSAWIFVPRDRHIGVAPDGRSAWFDEVAGSAHFGDCRGTGTLLLVDGVWRVALYDLTVPVPNELLDGVVATIRRGSSEPVTATEVTTVYVVRHAEKGPGDDPALSEAGTARADALARMLVDVPVSAAFATNYRRTRETVAGVAKSHGIETTVVDARRTDELAARIRAAPAGASVVVAGHSNTVPALLRALGVTTELKLGEDDYDDLFVVTLDRASGARLTRLHYGAAAR